MAKCEICGKGVSYGIKVSHSHRRTNRTWKPNVKRVKAIVKGTPCHIYVCSRCLRSNKVTRAVWFILFKSALIIIGTNCRCLCGIKEIYEVYRFCDTPLSLSAKTQKIKKLMFIVKKCLTNIKSCAIIQSRPKNEIIIYNIWNGEKTWKTITQSKR